MSNVSLTEFASKVTEKGRISFGDVQRLRRDIFPDGLTSCEDAELLFDLDRRVTKADKAWSQWLVAASVDFVVWAERPTGIVEEETALWLTAALTSGGATPSKVARLIAREIAEDAQAFENDAFAALARVGASSGSKSRMQQSEGASLPAA